MDENPYRAPENVEEPDERKVRAKQNRGVTFAMAFVTVIMWMTAWSARPMGTEFVVACLLGSVMPALFVCWKLFGGKRR